MIQDVKAVELLTDAIHHTVIYRNPELYVHALDTFYVESYNSTMNIWLDKRITYQDEQYEMRSNWTTLHWNENVDRPYTSIWEGPSHSASGQTVQRKVLVPCTFKYRTNVWENIMDKIYQDTPP